MTSNKFKILGTLAMSTSALALSAPAFAQLDEIIVTAQKRTENLQDVPVAITAFDLNALESNRLEGVEDIGTFTPSVRVTQNPADPNGVRIAIRGVGTFDPQVGQDSRVAIYQDGVYLGKTQGLAFDMPDLARVEVLKGPQGTLYGRNTVAGAINLVSAVPDASEFSAKIKGEYGNYDHKKISGAVNVPLAETAAARFSASYMSRDGWVENTGPGSDFGGEKKFGARAALGFEVGDAVRLDFSADYNKTEKEPLFYQSFGPGAQPFAAAITPFDSGRQETVATTQGNEAGNLETKGVSAVATWDVAENQELKITAAYREMESSRFVNLIPTTNSAILNQITAGFNQVMLSLPNSFAITNTPLRSDYLSGFTGQNAMERGLFLSPEGGSANLPDHNQFSLEATYTGDFADGRVEYTGGAFYYNESTGTGEGIPNPLNANDYLFVLGAFNRRVTPLSTHNFLAQDVDPRPGFVSTLIPGYTTLDQPNAAAPNPPGPGLPCVLAATPTTLCASPLTAAGFFLPSLTQIPGPLGQGALQQLQIVNGFNQAFLSAARQSASNTLNIDTTAFAIYGQATFHVSEDFRITAGLRYSDESKDGVGQPKSPFFNDNIDLTGGTILPNISSFDDQVLDPSLTVEFDPTDDIMIYASYKESFRSGGFNNSAVALRLPGETYGADFNFGREDITAYEAGFKGDFGDRVRINAAGFYYDFANKQTTFSLNPLIATERAVVNRDDEIYGFEVDGQFALMDGLKLTGSYTYIDGTAGDTVNPNDPTDIRSFPELQGTPKNSYLIGLDYDGASGIFGNISYSHKDDVLSIPENALRLPAVNLVNARVGKSFSLASGADVSLALWATNLLDEEYLIDGLPFQTFAYETKVYGQPRSYGVTLGMNF